MYDNVMFRYLAPSGRYGRCEHSQTLQEAQLSRNASRDSVHSIHVTEHHGGSVGGGVGTSCSGGTSVYIPVTGNVCGGGYGGGGGGGLGLSGTGGSRDPAIRRQHSQPESSCMYCQTHRYMYVIFI